MKKNILLCIPLACLLLACDQGTRTETIVHEDGSLDRAITLGVPAKRNPVLKHTDIFQLTPELGWRSDTVDRRYSGDTDSVVSEYVMRYRQSFPSVAEANRVMNTNHDFFRIESRFEKKFRWFYTYITYADTYKAINRFNLPLSDYLAEEDYAFIRRMPAETHRIATADSLYLDQLTHKLYEQYGMRAYFEEHFAALCSAERKHAAGKHYDDSLKHHKEKIFSSIIRHNDINREVAVALLDSLGIPFPPAAQEEYERWLKGQEQRLSFMFTAGLGKYVHSIEMPWTVVASNADSVAGRVLLWRPPVIKFMAGDYTMTAEARKLNYWAVVGSALFVLVAGVLVFRRRGVS